MPELPELRERAAIPTPEDDPSPPTPADDIPPRAKRRRPPRPYVNLRGAIQREELFEILEGALANEGWNAFSLREIARGAGVSVGLIHHHFASRGDLARSFYDAVALRLCLHVEKCERAPFAVVFRDFVAFSLSEHAFLGLAYVDAVRHAFVVREPLTSLGRVFALLVRKSTDLEPYRAPEWLLAAIHRALIELFFFTNERAFVLAEAERIAAAFVSLASDRDAATDLAIIGTAFGVPATQLAGTDCHRDQVWRSFTHGIPSRNPRRATDSRRREG